MANIPTYGEWLETVDMSSAYDYHKRVLQVLRSSGVRGRWSLKAPAHALHLEALTAVYPDARLVMAHRDPVVVVTSACKPDPHADRDILRRRPQRLYRPALDGDAGTVRRRREQVSRRQSG
jgi:hypothetical protein